MSSSKRGAEASSDDPSWKRRDGRLIRGNPKEDVFWWSKIRENEYVLVIHDGEDYLRAQQNGKQRYDGRDVVRLIEQTHCIESVRLCQRATVDCHKTWNGFCAICVALMKHRSLKKVKCRLSNIFLDCMKLRLGRVETLKVVSLAGFCDHPYWRPKSFMAVEEIKINIGRMGVSNFNTEHWTNIFASRPNLRKIILESYSIPEDWKPLVQKLSENTMVESFIIDDDWTRETRYLAIFGNLNVIRNATTDEITLEALEVVSSWYRASHSVDMLYI